MNTNPVVEFRQMNYKNLNSLVSEAKALKINIMVQGSINMNKYKNAHLA